MSAPVRVEAVPVIAVAPPWTYWIAWVLLPVAVLSLVRIMVMYFIRVVSARYPRQ